jgi:hypothetical protein
VKHLKHPATVIAAVALFIALGGGAVAYAAGVINGSQIKNHSIAKKKLTKKAIKQLKGNRGPAGPAGAAGPPGPKGDTGPQGPGGSIVTFDATGTASPTAKALGTFLGDTFSAKCVTNAGDAELTLNFSTSDGSWVTDAGEIDSGSGGGSVFAGYINAPAGTFTAPFAFTITATAGGDTESTSIDFVQSSPSSGSMTWNLTADTTGTNPTCHASIESIPEAITKVTGTPHGSTTRSQVQQLLFGKH